jgi:hypothetical protein
MRAVQVQPSSRPTLLSSCEADFDGNKRIDAALLVLSGSGLELLVVLRGGDGKAFMLADGIAPLAELRCETGAEMRELPAGAARRTPGAYIILDQLEGAKLAYVWRGKRFVELAISD